MSSPGNEYWQKVEDDLAAKGSLIVAEELIASVKRAEARVEQLEAFINEWLSCDDCELVSCPTHVEQVNRVTAPPNFRQNARS